MSEKILILGNSAAGAKAAFDIKAAQPSWDVSIFSYDTFYPSRADYYGSFMEKKAAVKDALYKEEKAYKEAGIKVIVGKELTRINLKRKKVHHEDHGQLDFTKLIITELPGHRFPEIKGYNKSGVLGFQKFADMVAIKKQAFLSDVLVVQANSWKAFELALKISQYNKEVYVICHDDAEFIRGFSPEAWQWIKEILAARQISFLNGTQLQEILGDAEVKAVRLSSGKVIAADVIILEDTPSDFRVFSDEDISLNKTFPMKSEMETEIEGVFVLPQVIDYKKASPLLDVLEEQGSQMAAVILGQTAVISALSTSYRHFAIENLSLHLIGNVNLSEGDIQVTDVLSPQEKKYNRYFAQNQIIKGALLVNADNISDMVKTAIAEGKSVADLEQQLNIPINQDQPTVSLSSSS